MRTIFSSYFYLSFFYFVEYILFFDEISYFALRNALYNLSCCSIFNDRAAPCGQLDYYTTSPRLCQDLFRNFLKTFSSPFSLACLTPSRYPPLSRRLAYYTAFFPFCQYLFWIFFRGMYWFVQINKHYHKNSQWSGQCLQYSSEL